MVNHMKLAPDRNNQIFILKHGKPFLTIKTSNKSRKALFYNWISSCFSTKLEEL